LTAELGGAAVAGGLIGIPADASEEITRAEQDGSTHESSHRKRYHCRQLLTSFSALPGEKCEDDDHRTKRHENPANTHQTRSQS
jgi:hypothetical protein